MSDTQVARVLDELALTRGLTTVIRSDNGPEFVGKAMLNWAHHNGFQLKQIEPGKPNRNACIQFFNGRFRDECLNEHWFVSLAHAATIIRGWHREYNEQRPKKQRSRLTPAVYAVRLAAEAAI